MAAKIRQFDDAAAQRSLTKQRKRLESNFVELQDLLGLVEQMAWRLPMFAQPRRRAEVVRVLRYIEGMSFNVEKLSAVLVCLRVLEERFQSEAA